LSDVEESDVESDKGYDSLAGQLDFVQFSWDRFWIIYVHNFWL
jgi:hypothetical protein